MSDKKKTNLNALLSDCLTDMCTRMGDYPHSYIVTPDTYKFVLPYTMRDKIYSCEDGYEGVRWDDDSGQFWWMDFPIEFREDVYNIDLVQVMMPTISNPLPFDEIKEIDNA